MHDVGQVPLQSSTCANESDRGSNLHDVGDLPLKVDTMAYESGNHVGVRFVVGMVDIMTLTNWHLGHTSKSMVENKERPQTL